MMPSLFKQLFVLVVCLGLLSSKVTRVLALEARWTAADKDNEPLPQSANYRAKLRELCQKLARGHMSGRRLGGTVDKDSLKKNCEKLKRDDENVVAAAREERGSSLTARVGRTVALAAALAAVWTAWKSYGHLARRYIKRLLALGRRHASAIHVVRGGETTDDIAAAMQSLAEMRMARLKRFDEDGGGAPPTNS